MPKRRAMDGRLRFSMKDLKAKLDVPQGRFYEMLVALSRRHDVPGDRFKQLIRQRMQQIGKPGLYKKWVELVNKRRVFQKVLAGEPRAKYRFNVPKTEKAIKNQIDKMALEIAEILQSI